MISATHSNDIDSEESDFPSEAGRAAIALHTSAVIELASPADIHAAMMQLDEQALLAEIMGDALDKWFYSFKVSGKMVEGVSAKGAHEFARLRAEQGFPIRFPIDGIRYEEATENGELGVRATIVAREHRTSQEAIGIAFYPYNSTRADGRKEFDKFAGRKAMSVAERNAILRLTPEHIIVAALKMRAQVTAANELAVTERARVAAASRPVARVETVAPGARAKALADPYAPPTASAAPAPASAAPAAPTNDLPPCPVCAGEMWDNRQTRKNPRSPDFKCKNGPRSRGGPGCTGVIWPKPDATPTDALPLENTDRPATTRGTNALREG